MKPEGLIIIENFITPDDEEILKNEILLSDLPFLNKSHLKFSNTKQQEYGPRISDKMELIKDKTIPYPKQLTKLKNKINLKIKELELDDNYLTFCRVNYYFKKDGGYMHKHMDSKKCFGPVIACCSLLSDTYMTFYNTKGNSYAMAKIHDTQIIKIPRFSIYFMTGESRTQWQHGILKKNCMSERLSITFRSIAENPPTINL